MKITLKTGETIEASEENAERLIDEGNACEYGKNIEKAVDPKKKKK